MLSAKQRNDRKKREDSPGIRDTIGRYDTIRTDKTKAQSRPYLSASALPHQQHLCGGPQFSLLAARPSSWHAAGSARRLSSRPPSRAERLPSCDLTHLLFEHRGHNAHQLQYHSTPHRQRVLVVHARGVQSLEPRLENSKNKNKISLLHQTRAYGVDRYPHRVFRHSGTSSSISYFPFTHSVIALAITPCLLALHSQPHSVLISDQVYILSIKSMDSLFYKNNSKFCINPARTPKCVWSAKGKKDRTCSRISEHMSCKRTSSCTG